MRRLTWRVPNVAICDGSPMNRQPPGQREVVFAPEPTRPHPAATWWRIRCPDGTTVYAKWPIVYVPRTGGMFTCSQVAAEDVPLIANDLPLRADGC